MAKTHVIDDEAFLPRLVAGLRKAWREVRAKRPGETFCLFGIETDSDPPESDRRGRPTGTVRPSRSAKRRVSLHACDALSGWPNQN